MVQARYKACEPRFFGRNGPHAGAALAAAAPGSVPGGSAEIGVRSIIGRGAAPGTVVGAGFRLDNLMQIGHGARMGRCHFVMAQAGILDSAAPEDVVVVTAQADLAGHMRARASIGARAGIIRHAGAGKKAAGSLAQPVREFLCGVAISRCLARRPSTPNAARPE